MIQEDIPDKITITPNGKVNVTDHIKDYSFWPELGCNII